MNKNISEVQALGDLFTDAAREVIERNRIKAQMHRLDKIMEIDNRRLSGLYAEIGKMYCDGTLSKNAHKVEMIKRSMEHLKLRLSRAQERMRQLKVAHSVDECTEAFKAELKDKVQKAQQATAEYAKDLSSKAKDAAQNISEKAADSIGDGKIAEVAQRAKITAEEIVARAVAASKRVRDAKKNDGIEVEDSGWDNFDENLDDLIFDDEEDTNYIEEYSEEDMAAAADIGAILQNIATALEEVDGGTAEEKPEMPQATDSKKPADELLENAQSEESAENFTF